jgi:ribosome-associated protein
VRIGDDWEIPDGDLHTSFVRSSGPGGQNVNKVATKVELRFQLGSTEALTDGQKRRLREAFPSYVTVSGEFVLSGDRHRSQARNLADVLERLGEMLESVRFEPEPRVATRPTRASKRRRLESKRGRSEAIARRKLPPRD